MAAVNLQNVNKVIAKNHILKDINLNIDKGEFVSVVGPSGCGKSTLLRLVAGLDKISSGQILINNLCVNKTPASKRDMAMVFQSYALYPHMTVFDNMAYGLKMRKYSKSDILKNVHEAAALLKLENFLSRKPHELSGGQRQRVAMGRAIVRSPAVFLFDEPLSNLDAKLRTEMRHEIKKLHQQLKTTCLYVTHDQTEAMTMADRIVVLNHGQIEQIGTPHELYQTPASIFVAGFTGHYPMNFFPAMIDDDNKLILADHVQCDLNHQSIQASPNEMIAAIRAEHLMIKDKEENGCFKCKIEFIDDMGADKLIQTIDVKQGQRLIIRTNADWVPCEDYVYIGLKTENIHLFDKALEQRIGA
jgi:sn-glycerol 3-phosphate transport system ATP-binding protein